MTPLFSIVIPTFNRPGELARCIESIGNLDCGRDSVEVIVVNDGGTIADAARLGAHAGGISVRLLEQSRQGPGAARNRAAFDARGEYIAFLDDDCLLPPDWMQRVSEAVSDHPQTLIGGLTINLLSRNAFSEASQTLVDYVYSYYNAPESFRTPLFTSNNMVVSTAMFRTFGGFDESFHAAEDRELCRRWNAQGLRTVFDRRIVVMHAHELSVTSLVRQHFGYGRGALPYWEKTSGGFRDLEVEPLSFYAGMLAFPFRARKRNAAALSSLITLTQIANAAGFAFAAAQRIFKRERSPVMAGKTESAL